MKIFAQCGLLISFIIHLSACNVVRVSEPVELMITAGDIIEEQLLNVEISVFSPLKDNADLDEYINLNNMRQAESYYTSLLLAETLQATAHWGRVNLNAGPSAGADIHIQGEIVQSDGQTMRINISVRDASGDAWFTHQYIQVIPEDNYQPITNTSNLEPFQDLYNKIANDIVAYQEDMLDVENILSIRKISQLQFANRLTPERYKDYLDVNGQGQISLLGFPAKNDQNFINIKEIQEKHNIYLDTLQSQYVNYKAQISASYNDFRKRSYTVTKRINDEILSPSSPVAADSPYSRFSALDAPKAKPPTAFERLLGRNANSSSLNRGARTEMYSRLLILSNRNLELELEPQSLEFNQRIYVLSGSVNEQYQQWSDILVELYELEQGSF